MKRLSQILLAAALVAPAVGCLDEDPFDGEAVKSDDGKADSSALGVFLDATFDGKLVTDSSWNDKQTIQDQLLYTVGQLNGYTAVGRVDKAEITNIHKTTTSDGKTQLTYTAKLLVIWRKSNGMPDKIDLKLPLDISYAGQEAFATKYKENCVDWGAHDVDAGSMFYYFRPRASGCNLTASDVHAVSASVALSPTATTGKFPEYNKIWEDNTLNVVAIFGKYEDGATTSADAGIDGYNEFVSAMKSELANRNLTTVPASVPTNPGVSAPDIQFNATLPDGKKIQVVALLTDNVNKGLQDPTFRARYESLSTRADFITYNGHAGLGSNIRALASAGKWVAGQYVVVFMNGCDTFAYIDGSLSSAHQAVNSDDTTGFKYIDIVNNGMPAFFSNMPESSLAIFRGMLSYDDPKTYEQILAKIDSSQLVMVTGEQDNAFTPGGGGQPQAWGGLNEQGSLARSVKKQFLTPTLAAGTYSFAMTGTGDADLYVKVGSAPSLTSYDCRPYKTGSNETCQVTLAQPAPIGVMVNGYAASSTFKLVGKKL
ncbi:MAG TPA: PPC domain-containing protein [Kofleriaceae bacterium]|nr:PPC domain-containing protein [Kofleriaceae bacterium]